MTEDEKREVLEWLGQWYAKDRPSESASLATMQAVLAAIEWHRSREKWMPIETAPTRYSPSYSPNNGPYMEEDSLGNYIRFSEIKKAMLALEPLGDICSAFNKQWSLEFLEYTKEQLAWVFFQKGLAMRARVPELEKYFLDLRCDPNHHLGLGDIRLTLAQQDEILAMIAAPKPDQPRPMLTVTDENGNKSVTYLDKPERDSVSRDTHGSKKEKISGCLFSKGKPIPHGDCTCLACEVARENGYTNQNPYEATP